MAEKIPHQICSKTKPKMLFPSAQQQSQSNLSTKSGFSQLPAFQIKLQQNESCDFDSNEHLEYIVGSQESEKSVDSLMESINQTTHRNILHTTTGLTATKGLNDRFKLKSMQDVTNVGLNYEKKGFSETLQAFNQQSSEYIEVEEKNFSQKAKEIELINEIQELPNSSTTEIQSTKMVWNLMFAPSYNIEIYKKHLMITCKGLLYANKCLRGPSEHYLKSKLVTLGSPKFKTNNKTLFFDLDETLIHSSSLKNASQTLNIQKSEVSQIVGINVRPYCTYLLQKLSSLYEIYIFTASSSQYAAMIRSYLDPENNLISGVLSRQNCMETKNGFFIKDLRIIKNRDLKNMLIIDNLAHSFGLQIDNGIPICEWYEDPQDEELKYLTSYLMSLYNESSLQMVNRDRLGLRKFIQDIQKSGCQSLSPWGKL